MVEGVSYDTCRSEFDEERNNYSELVHAASGASVSSHYALACLVSSKSYSPSLEEAPLNAAQCTSTYLYKFEALLLIS